MKPSPTSSGLHVQTRKLISNHCSSPPSPPPNLHSIKAAVASFLKQEWSLDILFLDTSTSSSDNDFLPSFVLAKLLLRIMQTTASHFCHLNPSIRVIWISRTDTASVEEDTSLSSAEQLNLLAHEFANRKMGQADDAHAHTLPNSNPSSVQHILVDQ